MCDRFCPSCRICDPSAECVGCHDVLSARELDHDGLCPACADVPTCDHCLVRVESTDANGACAACAVTADCLQSVACLAHRHHDGCRGGELDVLVHTQAEAENASAPHAPRCECADCVTARILSRLAAPQVANAWGATPADYAGYILDRCPAHVRPVVVRRLDAAGVSL